MYAAVNKINLYYNIEGYHDQAIILLHGNGEDHTIFNELGNLLKRDYKIIEVDLRSHGRSDMVSNLDYNDMASDIYELITSLKIKRPILIGFSDGAIIAMILASKYPYLIRKMVLCGPNINPNGLKTTELLKMKASYLLHKSDKVRLMIEQPNITLTQLQQISAPTLILAGEKDVIKPTHFQEIHENIPDSKLKIYPQKNHFDYIVNTDFAYKDIDFFLRK